MKQLIAQQEGKICSIVQTKAPVADWHTTAEKCHIRSLFRIYEIAQHHLLNTAADLIDSKKVKKL
jgi:hypothetical protein